MIRTILALLVPCVTALARDHGQYNSVSPEVRQWFRAQKSPKTGALCCNEADGTYAEEHIRTASTGPALRLTKGDWIPVPATLTATALPLRGGFCKTARSRSAATRRWRRLMKWYDEHRFGRRLTARHKSSAYPYRNLEN
jgi:hypothetical protein